jgi:hypothetical protein
MPHVVLEGEVGFEAVADGIEPVFEREEGSIRKTEAVWRARDEQALLLEGRAIEGGAPRTFLVRVDAREDGLVVRLHDFSDHVDRTDGVKRTLALVAEHVQELAPELSVGKTNLEAYLD